MNQTSQRVVVSYWAETFFAEGSAGTNRAKPGGPRRSSRWGGVQIKYYPDEEPGEMMSR